MKRNCFSFIVCLAMLSWIGLSWGATRQVPDVPTSKLTLAKALAIASAQFANEPEIRLVAIDWCQNSKFRPRLDDGSQITILDDPGGFSWFFTYLRKGKLDWDTSVVVFRVKDDGTLGRVINVG
jgi:hypothetical protein